MSHNFNRGVFFTVLRICTHFTRADGTALTPKWGTGFWMKHGNHFALVTNRHLVDLAFADPKLSDSRLTRLQIEIKDHAAVKEMKRPWIVDIVDFQESLVFHDDPRVDAVLVWNPIRSDNALLHLAHVVGSPEIADDMFFAELLEPMDEIFFIGFPGKAGIGWFDDELILPIARNGTIASWPAKSYANARISSNDILLASGMSFSGSSGSPVFLPERGIRPGGPITDSGYRPAKLIGIMSGHWWDDGDKAAPFLHSGLSHFTRSTAIWNLVTKRASRGLVTTHLT